MVFIAIPLPDGVGQRESLIAYCKSILAKRIGAGDAKILQVGTSAIIFDGRNSVLHTGTRSASIIFGDLIAEGSDSAERDAALLAQSAALGEDALCDFLRTCRGNFTAIGHDFRTRDAWLMTDCLSTRPIYYASTDHGMVATSHFRLWKELPISGLSVDPSATVEHAMFGFTLGVKTPIRGVRSMEAASILAVRDGYATSERRYWDWHTFLDVDKDVDKLADETFDAFKLGIVERAKRHGAGYCMLSGGMDSRVVAFVLAGAGARPTTVSFGLEDSCDRRIADELAGLLPGRHLSSSVAAWRFECLGGPLGIAAPMMHADAGPAESNLVVWTGDGGSCGLGGVYLDEAIARSAGDAAACARQFLKANRAGFSRRLISDTAVLNNDPERIIETEMEKFLAARADLMPYLFLMLNDQKKHCWRDIEDQFSTKVVIITPFFDFEFLKLLFKCPVEHILFHKFYMKFFDHLPATARSIPWQTYTGHVSCPVPPLPGAKSAWTRSSKFLSGDAAVYAMRARKVFWQALRHASSLRPFNSWGMALVGLAGIFLPERAQFHVNQAEAVLECVAIANGRRKPGLNLRICPEAKPPDRAERRFTSR